MLQPTDIQNFTIFKVWQQLIKHIFCFYTKFWANLQICKALY